MFDPFWKIFFLKSDFWAAKWSLDATKLSADSLEVTLQDSNKILMFTHFFRFPSENMQHLLMQKTLFEAPKGLCNRAKNVLRVKKCRFFKVRDTLTTMLPRKKKHRTIVVSPLKTFYDHSRTFWNNLNFLVFLYLFCFVGGFSA